MWMLILSTDTMLLRGCLYFLCFVEEGPIYGFILPFLLIGSGDTSTTITWIARVMGVRV